MIYLFMRESYPGESLMVRAIAEAQGYQYEMGSPDRFVCWIES